MLTGSRVSRAKVKDRQAASESKVEETVTQRAYNFSVAYRSVLQICGPRTLPQSKSISTLLPFGGPPVAGLPSQPNLMNPEAVFQELTIHAVTYTRALESGVPTASQWKWQPRYIGLPKQAWHANPTQLTIGLQRVRRRITGGTPSGQPSERGKASEKRRRISTMTSPSALL